jgi:hypothetical protein
MLTENGKTIFSTRREDLFETEDYLQLRKLYSQHGIATQLLDDKLPGLELELISPGREVSWRFNVTHLNIGFEYPLGGRFGSTGYSGLVTGGQAGREQSGGPAFSEIMDFPKSSILFSKNYI